MVGALLGNRYELIEKIGTGGMADVYKAKCNLLNRNVAIKILKDEYKNDEEFLKRFNIESQAAAGLSHNNIVSIYDVGVQGEIHYIVMEYVEGITLKAFLKENGPLPWKKAVDFAMQIASALQHAHRKGIVHRDIKPQNILVTKDDVLKVTDFGIARAVSSVTVKVDDNSMGTAHYCSPEQARGGYTDEKSDIYSLGVVMYEMITGKLPFESDSSVTVALKHILEEPDLPSNCVEGLPAVIEEIILKAMKKEQSERFQSASDLLIELSLATRNENYTISKKDNSSETKVIPSKEVKKAIEKTESSAEISNKQETSVSRETVKKVKSKETKKEDKVAVIAALFASFAFVAIISLIVVALVFPSILPWNRPKDEIKAPNLVGYSFEKAVDDFEEFNIKKDGEEYSSKYEEGIIISQSPDAKTALKSPFTVKVVISKGREKVKVPEIENLEYRQAIIELEKLNILYTVEYEQNREFPENIVMEVSPKAGTTVSTHKDVVTLTVSSGVSQSFVVPTVLDMTEEKAKEEITSKGFNVKVEEKDSAKEKGIVIAQSIAGGSQLAEKATITITVSTGNLPKEPEGTVQNPDNPTAPQNPTTPQTPTTPPSTPVETPEETGSWF